MPEESRTHLYEGLFLFSQQAVSEDFNACMEHLKTILDRAQATVEVMEKWAERRLAYEIKKQKRGTFVLAYFNAQPGQIIHIERDCNLSETVLRHLIIKADHIGETELELAKKDAEPSVEVKLQSDLSTPVSASSSAESKSEAATAEA